MTSSTWALCAAVTEEMLNDLAILAVGDGVTLDQVETDVALPGMGDVRLRLTLTVTSGTFDLRADDNGRARVVIHASGDVAVEALGFEGSSAPAATMLPSGPVPIPVRVEALVDPVVEVRDDLTVEVGLAVRGGELVGVTVDGDAPAPDGVDADAWVGMSQMVNMLFSTMGEQLWAGLGEHVGVVGDELPAEVGAVLADLGVAPGRADVRIATGLMTLGLPARDDVVGHAPPVPVAGKRLALSLAGSGVDTVASRLLALVVGNRPLPFEIDVELGDQRVQGRLRQTRLLSERIPDLRLALRTDLRPRLVGGRLEVSLRAAWVEVPELFPTFGLTGLINDLSHRMGGFASLAPLRLRFPSVIQVPIGGGRPGNAPETIGIEVDDLLVTRDGVGIVAGLA